ncbi:hypothetical protein CONCODRAFT_46188 [Conidiobolus coronatus NRRL 28638]|uniref:Core domain-containing protein n=1 Tax=Conidiobolus coronatus (strain ATCC 28846 / CBS 209.66 / NRRL 28638) TaxID=796925 RepID=A0A137PGR3_CONC2|nr:hypothetical protein CONCODRAFT_46188 [Conidiobolus coronatus NRRL 28638]|eukprot:KXN74182.1 hypothetical protein CONCODRAFT_46188 [Conidiobolus coronatus NRRL 28638]
MSDKCVERILYTQKRDNNPKQALRVIIESGGCHGFKISFDITDKYTKDDVIFEKNGAKVVTNKAYLPLIGGSEVDFETELIGSTFRLFNNPNAASGCGCGISFELK